MSSSMSSGWLTCRVCCCSAQWDGGGADRMRAECTNEKCPKLQTVVPTDEASREIIEWGKRRKEVAASIDAELMRRFKQAISGKK